jgi:alcohol dehydrogenase
MIDSFATRTTPRLIFGAGTLGQLAECVREAGGSHVLLVSDAGIVAAGHVDRAREQLEADGIGVSIYDGVRENPGEADIERCREFAEGLPVDCIVGLGGGSSMDTAKGCNFLLADGGRMSDFKGYGQAKGAMLPFIAVPTTAGTGSECQSYAVVCRDGTHEKMACGDPKALARVAILDPELTESQPDKVAHLTALDAVSHALESAVCTRRNPLSSMYSREAFRRLAAGVGAVLANEATMEDRGTVMLGASFAGKAIENSMLGAAHAAANPVTARYGLVHGHAVALTLPVVVRWNHEQEEAAGVYRELGECIGEPLPEWLERTVAAARLPDLDGLDIGEDEIAVMAKEASAQWTGQFNPRPMEEEDFAFVYRCLVGMKPVS